jgi:uncharacterized alpha-E superfamily protein
MSGAVDKKTEPAKQEEAVALQAERDAREIARLKAKLAAVHEVSTNLLQAVASVGVDDDAVESVIDLMEAATTAARRVRDLLEDDA